MPAEQSSPIVTVFRSRLRTDAAARDYPSVAAEMERQARDMPGFKDFKTFTAGDGERVAIVEFDSIEDHNRWRDHAGHRTAQQRGRDDFYREYRIIVAEVLTEHSFSADAIGDR